MDIIQIKSNNEQVILNCETIMAVVQSNTTITIYLNVPGKNRVDLSFSTPREAKEIMIDIYDTLTNKK